MPSDPRTAAALAALQAPRDAFASAVAATLEELRVYLDTHRGYVADVSALPRRSGPSTRPACASHGASTGCR